MLRKNIMIFILIEMITVPATKPPTYYPTLPMGEYKFRIKAVSQCEHFEHGNIQFNIFISKAGPTKYVFKGNLTFLIPFDDSLSLNYSFAKRGSIGGWAENYYVVSLTKACSAWKSLLGNNWHVITEELKLSIDCPLREGVYVTSGVDLTKLKKHNYPKVFFYGEYRLKFSIKNSTTGITVGCIYYFVDILRPWEY